ncbi:MAG: sulfur transferase domain-containing protein [Pseudomonadota bacterium]
MHSRPISLRTVTALFASVLLVAGCATTRDSTTPPPVYLGDGAKAVNDHVYVGGQPDVEQFAELKNAGITKVISFRRPEEMAKLGFDEPAELAALGIDYINIPMGGDDPGYTPAQVDALTRALDDPNEKVLLHCTIGWRASVITVAYLVQEKGLSLDEAMTHAQHWWPLQLSKMLNRPLALSFADDPG